MSISRRLYKKKVFIIDSLNKDNLDTIHHFMLV